MQRRRVSEEVFRYVKAHQAEEEIDGTWTKKHRLNTPAAAVIRMASVIRIYCVKERVR